MKVYCQDDPIGGIREDATSVLNGDRKDGRCHYTFHSESSVQMVRHVKREVLSSHFVRVSELLGLKAAEGTLTFHAENGLGDASKGGT